MNGATNHIISRLKWDTQVSDKEMSFDFQNRISDWSNTTMLRNMDAVFNKMPIENGIWRIEELELDLGKINYNNLEEELSIQFIQSLTEKLSDMILRTTYDDVELEIIDVDTNGIQVLAYFLKHGYLPWYNHVKGKSINQIVTELFLSNKEETVSVIEDLMRTKPIRKRVVWQFDSENLKQLVQGIEPSNCDFIFSFSSSITKIQKKENIVKSSSTDFDKGIWMWIMNHLIDERGSIFNKVEFVKSTIVQMANHYNISSDVLFELILEATRQNQDFGMSNAPLLTALNIIDKQNKRGSRVSDLKDNQPRKATAINQKDAHENPDYSLKRANKLFQAILDKLNFNSFYSKDLAELQTLLENAIESNPKLINTLISQLLRKNRNIDLLPLFFDDYQFQILFQNSKLSSVSTLKLFKQLLDEIDEKSPLFASAKLTIRELYRSQISFLKYKTDSDEEAAKRLVLDVFIKIPHKSKKELHAVFGSIYSDSDVSTYYKADIFSKIYSLKSTAEIIDFVLKYIEQFPDSKNEIQQFLYEKWNANEFDVYKILNTEEGQKLLANFLPMSLSKLNELINSILEEHPKLALRSKSETFKQSLWVLVWRCALDTSLLANSRDESMAKALKKSIYFKHHKLFSKRKIKASNESIADIKSLDKKSIKSLKVGLEKNTQFVKIGGEKKELDSFLRELLTSIPKTLMSIIQGVKISENLIKRFEKCFVLDDLLIKFGRFSIGWRKEYLQSILLMNYILIEHKKTEAISKIQRLFWRSTLRSISGSKPKVDFREAVVSTLAYCARNTDSEWSLEEILSSKKLLLSRLLSKVICDVDKRYKKKDFGTSKLIKSQSLTRCEKLGMMNELTAHMFLTNQLPPWFKGASKESKAEVFSQLLAFWPASILVHVKNNRISNASLLKLIEEIGIEKLLSLLIKEQPSRSFLINKIRRVYQLFKDIDRVNSHPIELRHILGLIVLKAWATDNWDLLRNDNFWKSMHLELRHKSNMTKTDFNKLILPKKKKLPSRYKSSLEESNKEIEIKNENNIINEEKFQSNKKLESKMTELSKEGISIENAGLVLINNYINVLFDRLGLLQDGNFIDANSQIRAIQYLHYLCSGSEKSEEQMLSLNKLICGVDIGTPIPSSIDISAEDKELIDSLLAAVISHWSAIGDSTADGFRGNWIVRSGLLTELEDRWELNVEKRAYDLLIGQSPFSFGIIKYPWMPKPLHVSWPY